MSTDISDLGMLQISDSFFPTGMYTMSNGLEALFYSKRKMTFEELRDLIKVFVEYQIGPADCTALGNAYESASKGDLKSVIAVDRTIHAMKLVKEIRSASTRSGTQMLRCVNYFITDNKIINDYAAAIKAGEAHGSYPVALALACNAMSIPKRKAGLALLYSFSMSMVGAALRLGMFQHFDGQRIINELKPSIAHAIDAFIDRPLEGMWQFCPQLDIVQISHEKMSSKMFIT
ncbi:MAG: urease accessory protein [Nitrososphaera sp.]|nr:urease accessory protein [Nitrososphaera sp.]